jgi:hypothetical protein
MWGAEAMAKYDPYENCAIQKKDKVAGKLTMEQVEALISFYNRQNCSFSDDVPLQELLNLWHASIEWCSFEDWLEEKPEEAAAAYNRCISDRSKHFRVEG